MDNYSFVVLFLLFTDILTKWIVAAFGFSYNRSYGLLFGFIGDRGNLSLILGAISILTAIIFLRKRDTLKVGLCHRRGGVPLWREFDTFRLWSGALFLSGALGNFFTRLFLGYIIDFLPGGFMGHFFNLADVYLFVGLIGIIISEMKRAT